LPIIDSEVRVEGLETLDYLDNLYQKERFTEQGDALTFESEVRKLMILIQAHPYINQVKLICNP